MNFVQHFLMLTDTPSSLYYCAISELNSSITACRLLLWTDYNSLFALKIDCKYKTWRCNSWNLRMSGHETKMSHIELERQQAGRQSDDNEVLANHVSESFVQERLDDILDQLSAIMTEHPNQEGGEEKSHVDKKVVATAIYNRKNLGRESPPLPSSPRLEDKYVAMHGQVRLCSSF